MKEPIHRLAGALAWASQRAPHLTILQILEQSTSGSMDLSDEELIRQIEDFAKSLTPNLRLVHE